MRGSRWRVVPPTAGLLAAGLLWLPVLPADEPAAASAISWQPPVRVASGGGHQGAWRMNESDYRYVDDASVDLDDRGTAALVWVDQARKDVFFQAYGPQGEEPLAQPVNVSRSPDTFSWLPRVLVRRGDPLEIHVLWQEIIFSGGSHGGDILYARSTDGGRTFGDPVNLSKDVAGSGKGRLTKRYWHNGSLDLAGGPGGALYAAWTEYEGTLWLSRSTDGGASFSEPLRVGGTERQPARAPSVSVGAGADVYLAWTVGEDRAADIHLARSSDGGLSFGAPRPVLHDGAHADAPKIAVDGNGRLHLVYGRSPAGPFGRYHVAYGRSSDGGETFDGPLDISGAHRTGFRSVNFPALDLDADHNLYVLWELYPGREPRARGLGYTWSDDGGASFARPSVVPGTLGPGLGVNGSLQGSLMRKLAVGPDGTVAVVNSRFQEGEASRVRLFRGQSRLP